MLGNLSYGRISMTSRAAHRTTPICDSEWLEYTVNGRSQRIAVESKAWHAWLKSSTHTTFYFVSSAGTFTARREQRRTRSYWYAYSKKAGKLRKVYLGSAARLTLKQLIQAATVLSNQLTVPTPTTTLLQTKFMVPPAHIELVSRPRIDALLNQGLPLTMISAPAGFGKTTLVAEWSRVQPHTVAWLALDSNDNDPQRFWSYVLTALHNVAPMIAAEALALLHAPQAIALAHILTALINTLKTSTQPLVLVLDDYHLISDKAIHENLVFLIDHAPLQFQLVLLSRAEPPFPLARWRVAGRLGEIQADTLRFSKTEMRLFFRTTRQVDLPDETLVTLEARIEGWIAGLQMIALSTHGHNPITITDLLDTISGSYRAIFDYFTQEILRQQPMEIQQFLLQTAILDRLSEPLCAAVVDQGTLAPLSLSESGLLDHLARFNLFVVALDTKQHWYRYHQLFKESLLHNAQQRLGVVGIAQLHGRASCWFERAGLPIEAINHALAAADFSRAGALIALIGFTFLLNDEFLLLQGWLQALPVAVIECNAYLCLWSAWILVSRNQLQASEHYLNLIGELLAHMQESPETTLVWGYFWALQAKVAGRRGDMPTTLALTHQALSVLPRHSAILRSVITRNLCAGYIISGDTRAADVALHQALREQELLESQVSSVHSLSSERQYARTARLLLWVETTSLRWLQGQFHIAADLYRQTLHLSREQHQHYVSAIACVNLGQILRQWNDLDQAEAYIQQGNAYSLQIGANVTRRNGLIELARIQQARGETLYAQATMAQAVELAHTLSSTRGLLWATTWQARLQLAQGDLAAATRWAQEYQRQVHPFPQFNLYDAEDLTLVRVLIAQGHLNQSAALLERLLPAYQLAGRLPSVIEVYLLQALTLVAQHAWTDADKILIQALKLAEPEGYIRLFVDEGSVLIDLLVQLEPQLQGRIRLYVQRLLTASGLRMTTAPYLIESSVYPFVEPLSERELEVVRLLAAGFSNQEIAYKLIVTLNTIKTHLKNIYAKLAVNSRTQAIARARSLNLIGRNN